MRDVQSLAAKSTKEDRFGKQTEKEVRKEGRKRRQTLEKHNQTTRKRNPSKADDREYTDPTPETRNLASEIKRSHHERRKSLMDERKNCHSALCLFCNTYLIHCYFIYIQK